MTSCHDAKYVLHAQIEGILYIDIIIIVPYLHCYAGQIYEGPSFIQLNTIAKCMDDEFKNK